MKEYLGIFLFCFTYFAIASQVIGVYFTWDEDILTYLLWHKIYFGAIAFLAILSHIRASFTNPGRITHDNNVSVLEFYMTTHKDAKDKAEGMNIQYKHLIQMWKRSMPPLEDDEHSDIDSGDENVEYSRDSDISDKKLEELNSDLKMNFERCKRCYVIRVPKTHHCSKCQHCIMKMDHHCPWINNCVGIFNQKYFILFCYYCLIGCSHACYITTYYYIILHKNDFLNSAFLVTIYSIQMLAAIVFIIFNVFMLKDQWHAIKEDVTLIDQKLGKFIEARSLGEVLYEVFGESFSPFWFLPVDRSSRMRIRKRKRN